MVDAGSIVYKITADVGQFKNALSDVGKATTGLGNDMQKNGENIGNKILSGIKSVITVGAIAKFLNDTISEGANLQQSYIGGLDTLYGQGADNMRKYAMEASKAGISANNYAEQAVSFGAALKQSFKGAEDAEIKAGEAANQAILDMADNSAKMGTDLASIQNAYQGFAKQNYTMLDNLKLGYGGTKTEMERLLKDAEKLSGIKYDINNLADVYSAIHVIQEELGIAGVAADEAQDTITGSFNAMKASWQNFLGMLTLGEDVGPALEKLINSVGTYLAKNLFPAIANVLRGLPSAIYNVVMSYLPQFMTYITEVITSIANDISQNLPTILQKGWELLETLANGIIENIPTILSAIFEVMISIGKAILQNFPMILQRGIELIGKLGSGILQSIPGLFSQVKSAFASIDWLSIGSAIIRGIVNGIKNGASAVWNAARDVASSAFNAAKNFLGIHSPSKRFEYLGKQADEGLALGIDKNTDIVEDSMKGLSDMMLDTDLTMGKPNLNNYNSVNGDNSNSINYGGIVINMNVPEGTNATQLVNQMEYELAKRTIRREVVFG